MWRAYIVSHVQDRRQVKKRTKGELNVKIKKGKTLKYQKALVNNLNQSPNSPSTIRAKILTEESQEFLPRYDYLRQNQIYDKTQSISLIAVIQINYETVIRQMTPKNATQGKGLTGSAKCKIFNLSLKKNHDLRMSSLECQTTKRCEVR